MTHPHWNGFAAGKWQEEINVRDFIQTNYTPYEGDDRFLADATPRIELGWRNAPTHNLYNSSGYLASPFQVIL